MTPRCPGCDLVFEREPGYWVGAIYLNYGLTTLLMIAAYFALEAFAGISPGGRLLVCAAIGLFVPLLFFRHARVLWMSVDRLLDPSDGDRPAPRRRGAA